MQSINIYVGENSSGKSMRLGDIARDNIKSGRTVIAIATSFNDKYPKRKPNAPYFYMGPRLGQSMAKKAIKSSISKLNEKDGLLQLNTLFSILEYTKIEPQIGLIIKGFNNYFDDDLEEIQFINNADKELALYLCYKIRSHYDKYNDFIHWISSYSRFNEGLSGEFLSDIIKHEKLLRKYKLIRGVELYVKKDDLSLPINKLSSGQLSLISTTFFIASYLRNGAVILIDEPENSLHPSWQRQYISNLKDLFPYYECEYHIATHSPMIISGAIDEKGVKVHRHNGTYFEEIEINTKNIEDAYIDQFGIVTPENNSLSERCIDIINSVNDGELSKYKAISILNKYKSASFESLQEEFINGVIDIVNDLGGG
ncbi:ATP-binding protein [Vibrio alginolyticus]|nr:hypothetical protein BAU10_00995 [Vibrio alginolyticus]